jgi:RNA polymerase sigma factor (sigma-70 family)
MELTDNQIMLAVKAGELEQLSVLFERHHASLFGFFYRMTGERAASEDLVQEVFLRMLRYRDTFHRESQFRGWMYQIARNLRIDDLRKRQSEVSLSREPTENRSGGSAWKTDCSEYSILLEQALLALPNEKREVLVLARYQEMKYEEIADLLGIGVGAVKVRVHRAMKELRELVLKMSGEKSRCDVKKSSNTLRTI